MIDNDLCLLVTATMSAGKSTLINALIGKKVVRTSQEVCTGNLCYIYNQSVENNKILLWKNGNLNQDADTKLLYSFDWLNPMSITCFFRSQYCSQKQICLIDTPGVDSSIHSGHGKITRNAVLSEKYHVLVYVLNAEKIGSDAEIKHLKWIFENVPKGKKIVFVLNKLDNFKSSEDSIPGSIRSAEQILKRIGDQTPCICPVSAYFGFLLKMKLYREKISKIQKIDYDFLTDKFQNSEYDLSVFYPHEKENTYENPDRILYHKCGMAGFEKVLFHLKDTDFAYKQ